MNIHQLEPYYDNKRYCRIDIEKFSFKNDGNQVPTLHPMVKFLVFINAIKERNRLWKVRDEVYQIISSIANAIVAFKMAQSIHPCAAPNSAQDILNDLDSRIQRQLNKIEKFHSEYSI